MPRQPKPPIDPPICPYCSRPSVLEPDAAVYSGGGYGGKVYLCRPCDAWVGVHKNSPRNAPLGRLANLKLRRMKVQAHHGLDAMWRALMRTRKLSQFQARRITYQWLSDELQLPLEQTHIGMFDEARTQQTIDLIQAHVNRAKAAVQGDHNGRT